MVTNLIVLPATSQPKAQSTYGVQQVKQGDAPASNVFEPLPGSCVGGLPGSNGTPACCMFGYVFLDGVAVAGARIRISNQHNQSVDVWTAYGPHSDQPYYQISLTDGPLSMQPGEQLFVEADYSSHHTTTPLSHTVLSGGQQLDITLARQGVIDYRVETQYWRQAAPKTFNLYRSDVVVDGAGTVYVADWGNSRVQVFNRNGDFIRQWGRLSNQPGQFFNPSGIAVDQSGNIFVSDSSSQNIQKFTSTGEWLAKWGQAGSQDGEFGNPRDLTIDNEGYVYIVDPGQSRVHKYTNTGNFVKAWGGVGTGPGNLTNPEGIALGPNGLLYVADTGNARIQVFTRDGVPVSRWGSLGSGNGAFDQPLRVAVAPDGSVYVSDANPNDWSKGNSRIQRFSATGVFLGAWGSAGSGAGSFASPSGLSVDSATGNIYVADGINHRIQVFSATGSFINTWGEVSNTPGRTSSPWGIAVDTAGNVYASDTFQNRIIKLAPNGDELLRVGESQDSKLNLLFPMGVALDSAGNLYVTDTGNQRIQVYQPNGQWLNSWGGPGNGDGLFQEPVGIAVHGSDVYIVDSTTHEIQKFSTTGQFRWRRGGLGTGNGQLNYPRSVAVGLDGRVYIAEANNERISVFNPDGSWNTSWGSAGQGNGQFTTPAGIAVGSDGHVYVTEHDNYRFQVFDANGTWLLTWGGTGIGAGTFIQPARIAVGNTGLIYIAEANVGRIQSLRPITITRPNATITTTSARIVSQGTAITLIGRGAVGSSERTISSYEWLIDNVVFATSANASLATNQLSLGQHTLALRIYDNTGEASNLTTAIITVAGVSTGTETWTMLLYLDGDNDLDNALNANSHNGALYRLLHSSGPDNVTIAAIYDGFGQGNNSNYVLIRPHQQPEITALSEVDMDDPQTLIDFVRWGQRVAPATHYYLAIANHGNGFQGLAWDNSSAGDNSARISMPELRYALNAITANGTHPIDIIHLDACLMGMLEIAYQLRGMASYLIVSENLGWSFFGYESYLNTITTTTSPMALAQQIAKIYAEQVREQGLYYTISVLTMAKLETTVTSFDSFAKAMRRVRETNQADSGILDLIRRDVQKLDSGGDNVLSVNDEYVDLDHLAELVATRTNDTALVQAAQQLREQIRGLLLFERHDSGRIGKNAFTTLDLTNARGLAIYYPPTGSDRLYRMYQNELDLSVNTEWNDYLQPSLANTIIVSLQLTPIAPGDFQRQYKIFLPAIVR